MEKRDKLKKKILFFIGTRPELIKLYPLIYLFKKEKKLFETKVCFTNQHKELISSSLNIFKLKPDFQLNIMKQSQSIEYVTENLLNKIKKLYKKKYLPNLVFVQGDTNTAFGASLVSFYNKIKVAHIEAGLRTFRKYEPFPEETFRSMISKLADYHFTPTSYSKRNLIKEGINKNIYVVGNTVIDALKFCKKKKFKLKKKFALITIHRREHLNDKIKNIIEEINKITNANENIDFIWPIHPNPKIKKILNKYKNKKIIIRKHMDYNEFVNMLNKCEFVCSDSGGIQEECAYLGKKIFILRNFTERPEVLKNNGELIKLGKISLSNRVNYFLRKGIKVNRNFVFGNGHASKKIMKIVKANKFF